MVLIAAEIIALIGVILFIGFFAEILFRKFSIPNAVILLIIGLLLGPITATIPPRDLAGYANLFSPIALIIILFQGGLIMKIRSFIKGSPKALLLSFVNVLISIVAISLIGKYILGWDYVLGAILGAVIGGTSSPIVMPLITGSEVKKEIKSIISLESVSTDVLCIVFAIALINFSLGASSLAADPLSAIIKDVFTAFSTGIVVGIIGALFWAWVLKNVGTIEFDYVLTLGIIFIFYYISESLGGNGAISSLMFGLIFGNIGYLSSMLRTNIFNIKSAPIKEFHKEIYFFIETFFLVYLGTIVILENTTFLIIGILFSILLIAFRYIAVPIVVWGSSLSKDEVKLMSIISARGLAAAVLAPLPQIYGLPGSEGFSDIVFVVIIATVIATGIGYITLMRKKKEEPSGEKLNNQNAGSLNTG